MNKIEKQIIPIFFNKGEQPIAALLFIKGRRIIYTLSTASEEEIISLYEKEDLTIRN